MKTFVEVLGSVLTKIKTVKVMMIASMSIFFAPFVIAGLVLPCFASHSLYKIGKLSKENGKDLLNYYIECN